MLLYALYIPPVKTTWNSKRIFAFESVERLICAMRTFEGGENGFLELLTKEEALSASYIVPMYTGEDDEGKPLMNGASVFVCRDGVRNEGCGDIKEIGLVQTMAEESVLPLQASDLSNVARMKRRRARAKG